MNNKLLFLDVLIHTINNILPIFPNKKPTSTNSCTLDYKSYYPKQYKIVIIKNQIYRAKLINHINFNCNGNNATSNKHKHIKLFFRDQIHKHYKLDEIALKT